MSHVTFMFYGENSVIIAPHLVMCNGWNCELVHFYYVSYETSSSKVVVRVSVEVRVLRRAYCIC